ncbi:hypothetical protein ABK040_009327 [Willaertia magna]
MKTTIVLLGISLIICILSIVTICSSIPLKSITSQDETLVKAPIGTYRGLITTFNDQILHLTATARAFLGVRYAKLPKRWKPTEPIDPFQTVYNATNFQPGCPQRCELPPHTCPEQQSEDCLFLNIYTPRVANSPQNVKKSGTGFPILLFFPGGHFEQGTPGCPLYDSTYIANQTNVIVVVAAYRLGSLGWLANEKAGITGNYGLMDQLEVMKWIQMNIEAFGGDPSKVTIAGQSAGATSVSAWLISPKSKGLFHQAIIESNPVVLPMRYYQDMTTNVGIVFAKYLKCNENDYNCIASKPIEDILDAQYYIDKYTNFSIPLETFLPWTPCVNSPDGLVPYQLFEAMERNAFQKVPVIIGSVSEEALLFIYMGMKSMMNTVEYTALLFKIFGFENTLRLLDWYKPQLIGDKRPELSVLGTDYIFICPTRKIVLSNLAKQFSSFGIPVYHYIFDHVLTFDAWGPTYTYCVGHVCHGAELPFVFHSIGMSNNSKMPGMVFSKDEELLSRNIVKYWTNFVKFGNPNGQLKDNALTVWPVYTEQSPTTLMLRTPNCDIVNDYRQEYCNEWDIIGYNHGYDSKN